MAKASENKFPKVQFSEAAAPSTPSTGEAVTYVKTDGQFYFKNDAGDEYGLSRPTFSGAKVYKSADQANITDGNDILVTFNTTGYDTDSYFNDTSDRLEAPSTGYYLVTAGAYFYQGTLVAAAAVIQKNTSGHAMIGRLIETDATGAMPISVYSCSGSTVMQLDQGEYARLVVSIDSDGANNIDLRGGAEWTTWLSIAFLGA